MRDSFIFYRSYGEAMDELPDKDKLLLYEAIRHYGLDAQPPSFESPYLRAVWKVVKPQLDANWRKYENGKKGAEYGKRGGRPRKGNKENPKETPQKPQENPTRTPNVNVNGNENENVNEKDIDEKATLSSFSLSDEDWQKFCEWHEKECPSLLQMERPLTRDQLATIISLFDKGEVFDTLRAMDNRTDILKNKSEYRTLRDWLNRHKK